MQTFPTFYEIDFGFYLLALAAGMVHILFKISYAIHERKNSEFPFHFGLWLRCNIAYSIGSLLCGLLLVIAVAEIKPPVSYTKAMLAGLLAGSFMFNLYPIIISKSFWQNIFGKFLPKK